ncbi:DUF1652 domain-containing protein [Stutzerimonas stutzeri]|uniref:DUF1652 domain-containing protein n=1 Tax=Stutzerimonas sp. S1 TaxID=3030652 RepID=UPI0022242325|nr:DUF1652 domain-containing protein [Stutzerimonas sp. S1]MCW3148112.1 DUF1652 domain-containing protein [Stutzerimonas sp. S1]
MDSRLPLFKIEAILHDYLQPYRCECRAESSGLSVRVYGEQSDHEELTVLGVTHDQCRDAANLVRLAQELRIEMVVTRSEMPAERATASAID